MPVSAPISCSFYHYCSIIHLEVRDWFLLWSFIAENSFALLGFLLFQSDLQIALSNSMKNWVGILIGIVSVDCFHQDLVFTILILPIQEYGRSFHLLRSSSISFFRDLKFLSYRSFTCLVRVTPKIFYISYDFHEVCHFRNFFLSLFILWVYEGYWFLWVSFISCHFDEVVYQV